MIELIKKESSIIKEGVYYGIDLGTTYTIITAVDTNDILPAFKNIIPVQIITIPQHSPYDYDGSDQSEMIASVLGVDETGKMYVGNKLYRLKGDPKFLKDKNLFYHWKLDLGISQKPLYKEAAREDVDDASKVAGKILNYCRLNHLKEDKQWENVIVTVPASFQANQRQDVLRAINYANIRQDEQMLIDEPNAAFLGYLNEASTEEKHHLFSKSFHHVLVIDFGGGTCDLSILKLNKPEHMQLKISNLAISRYNDLGGQDLDAMIAELYLLPEFLQDYADADFTPQDIEEIIMPQLSVVAEKLKIDLARSIAARYISYCDIPENSTIYSTLRNVKIRHNDNDYDVDEFSLSFNQLKKVNTHIFINNEYQLQVVDKVIQSVPSVIKDILKKSNLSFIDIDSILFVGGSVQNLLFIQETMNLFQNAHALIPGRSDLLIAKGAAIYNFYKNSLGVELLQPINSDTLGIILHNSPFYPLIEAGKILPASVDLPTFTTQSVFQTDVTIPFCVNSEENIVGELKFSLSRILSQDDVISIEAHLSKDKVFRVKVFVENELLGETELINPSLLANSSAEERRMNEIQISLNEARAKKDSRKEETLLKELIFEYYGLGNYTRVGVLGEEWLNKFNRTSENINNILFCAYDALGNRKKARHYLEAGLKYSPKSFTLNYNMSIQLEKEKGSEAALNYLLALPEWVKNHPSIKFRITLLSSALHNNEPAIEIGKEYKEGKHRSLNLFDYNLLKSVLMLLGMDIYKRDAESRENEYSVDKKNLLRVSSSSLIL